MPSAARLGSARTVPASDVLDGRVDLRPHPFRYLAVVANRGTGADQVGFVLAAAEVLSQIGWELITVSEFTASRIVYAFLRRR